MLLYTFEEINQRRGVLVGKKLRTGLTSLQERMYKLLEWKLDDMTEENEHLIRMEAHITQLEAFADVVRQVCLDNGLGDVGGRYEGFKALRVLPVSHLLMEALGPGHIEHVFMYHDHTIVFTYLKLNRKRLLCRLSEEETETWVCAPLKPPQLEDLLLGKDTLLDAYQRCMSVQVIVDGQSYSMDPASVDSELLPQRGLRLEVRRSEEVRQHEEEGDRVQ